jgi:hypothetical protein
VRALAAAAAAAAASWPLLLLLRPAGAALLARWLAPAAPRAPPAKVNEWAGAAALAVPCH